MNIEEPVREDDKEEVYDFVLMFCFGSVLMIFFVGSHSLVSPSLVVMIGIYDGDDDDDGLDIIYKRV